MNTESMITKVESVVARIKKNLGATETPVVEAEKSIATPEAFLAHAESELAKAKGESDKVAKARLAVLAKAVSIVKAAVWEDTDAAGVKIPMYTDPGQYKNTTAEGSMTTVGPAATQYSENSVGEWLSSAQKRLAKIRKAMAKPEPDEEEEKAEKAAEPAEEDEAEKAKKAAAKENEDAEKALAGGGDLNKAGDLETDDETEKTKKSFDSKYINDLPDSAFLYIAKGGKKDAEGKTEPRTKRHFAFKDAEGNIVLERVKKAVGLIAKTEGVEAEARAEVQERAEDLLKKLEKRNIAKRGGDSDNWPRDMAAKAPTDKDYSFDED